jgi:uncharacterized protein YdbL (DUF1318 family)
VLKLFRFAILAAALTAAGAGTAPDAVAQTLNQLRAQGVIGERYDGRAVARKATPAVKKVVAGVNAKRLSIYSQRARKQGVSPAQIGTVYAKQIMKRAPKGTWFQVKNGRWSRK